MIFAITADVGLIFEDVSVHFVGTFEVPDSLPQSSTSRTRIHLYTCTKSLELKFFWLLASGHTKLRCKVAIKFQIW